MQAMRTRQQRRGLAKFSLPRIPDDLESASRAAAAGAGSSPNADGQDQRAAAPRDPGPDGGGTAPSTAEGGGDAREDVDPESDESDEPARLPDTAPPDIMIRPDGLVASPLDDPAGPPDDPLRPNAIDSAPPALPPMDPLGLNAEIGSPGPAAAATREQPQQPRTAGGAGIGGMMLTSPILGEETAIEEEEERGTARQVDGPAEPGEETGSYPPREEVPESEFVDASVLSGGPSTTSDAGGDGAGGRTGCPGSIGRWHPSPSFDSCTNSASYPRQWDDSAALAGELMHDTVDLCCGATFRGPGEECVVHNVCETVDLTYDEGFGPDPAPGPAGAEATAPGPGEAPVVMHTPAVVKEATSAPLKIDAEADRSAPAAQPAIQPEGVPEGSSEGAALAREDPVGMDAEPLLREARIGPGPDGTPVEMDAEPPIREAPIGSGPDGAPAQEEARAATREGEESDAADPTVEEEAAEAESEIAEALAGGGVGEVEAEQLEMELQRAVEDNNIDELEDVEEELELIEEEEEAALEGLDDGFDGEEDEVFPAYEDVSVTEEGEDGYVPPVGAGDGSHQETTHDEDRGDVRTGFPEDPDAEAPSGRERPPAPSPPSGLDGVDGLRDAPYEGDGFTSRPAFQLLRPKGSPPGGGSSPFPTAAAGGLAALALLALYVRRRRRSPPRRTLEYSALGTDDWDGTFSDDISFGRRYSDDDGDDDGCGSLGSYGSDEERGNGTVLEMGGIHETDANGGLCLREVNG